MLAWRTTSSNSTAARAGAEAIGAVQGLRRGRIALGVMQMSLVELLRTLARFNRRYAGIDLWMRQASAP